MKRNLILPVLFFIITCCSLQAQNVGIGTNTPNGRLQINHNSLSRPGLALVDSGTQSSGSLEFRHFNNSSRIVQRGYAPSNFHSEQYLDFFSDSMTIATFRGSGNLGVRNLYPVYPLDVQGDINTTGALRVNGAAGSNGQVLRSNGNGTMAWDDVCEYKNFVTLVSISTTTWTVPAGVTKIMIEAWGAGGGGNVLAGGGAGGYVKAYFTVTPGDIVTYITGDGGAGSVSASATNGTPTVVIIGSVSVTASGGQGAVFLTAANGQGGSGGTFSVTAGFNNYTGMQGSSGKSTERQYYMFNSTTFYESGKAGRGGDAYPFTNGGEGQTYIYNTTGSTLVFRNGNPSAGRIPGGGGASGVQFGVTGISGGTGADGSLTIYY